MFQQLLSKKQRIKNKILAKIAQMKQDSLTYRDLYKNEQDCLEQLIHKKRFQRVKQMQVLSKNVHTIQYLTVKDKFYQLAQNAEICMYYVSEICKQKQQEPLILRLVQMQIENVDKKLFKKKRQMFLQGIPIDTTIFSQDRITQAVVKQNSQPYFRFYPTSIVSERIFNLMNSNEMPGKVLIYGPFGISKTTSIMLYHYLSSQINKYLYLATAENRNDFIKKWTQRKVIIPKKLFYWSINLVSNQEDVVDIIRRQCPELDLPEEIYKINQIQDKIKKAYKSKKMECDVAIDQINKIAQVYRIQNRKPSQIPSQQFKIAKISYGYCNQIIKIAIRTGGNYYFNSSDNIQQQLLSKPNKNLIHTLNINEHTNITKFNLKYSKIMRQSFAQIQIDLIIAIQIAKKLPQGTVKRIFSNEGFNDNYQLMLQQIILKEKITKCRGNQKWEFCVSPLTIFQLVKHYDFPNIEKISLEILQSIIADIVYSLRQKSRQQMVEKIENFLGKGERRGQRLRLITLIYLRVLEQIKDEREDLNKMVDVPYSLQKEFLDEDFDKQIFTIRSQIFYEMELNLKQFIQIFTIPNFSSAISNQLFQLFERYFNGDQSGRNVFGRIVEDSLAKYLKNSRIDTTIIFGTCQGRFKKIIVKGTKQFSHLNNQSDTVYSHLKDLVDQCWKGLYKDQFYFGLPQTACKNPSHFCQSIDFIFMNIYKGTVTICSLDFATERTNIQKKLVKEEMKAVIEKVKGQKDLFSRDPQIIREVNWEHYVVVTPEWANCQAEQNNKKYYYQWVSFENFKIQKSVQSIDIKIFEKGVHLMMQKARQSI